MNEIQPKQPSIVRATSNFIRFVTLCVLVALSSSPITAQVTMLTCQGSDSCSCKMSDGTGVVDISSLGYSEGGPRFPDEKDFNGVSFSYNPCFSYTSGDCEGAAVCKNPLIGGSSWANFGTQKSAIWSHNGYYPIVSFVGNAGKSIVELICDMSFEEPQLFNYGELTLGEVTMQIFTKCACPGECQSVLPASGLEEGLTVGSILLIIGLVAVVVYLAAGVTYNRVKRQVSGAEMIPQREFWTGVPGLVKEGFVFSWGCVRHRGSRTEYEAV